MIHAVENEITEPLNLGSGDGVDIKAIVEIIVDNLEKNIKVKWDKTKPAGDKKRLMNMERAAGHGFKTSIGIERGICETMEWFNENREIIDARHNAFSK